MELRRLAEDGEDFKPILRGWCLGSEQFRKELLAQMSEKHGPEQLRARNKGVGPGESLENHPTGAGQVRLER